MRRHPVGYRYAHALFEVAQERNLLDQFNEELLIIVEAVKNTNLIEGTFKHSDLTNEEKKAMLKAAFEGKVDSALANLLYVLVDNGREQLLSVIQENYEDLANDARGIAKAHVISAKPLTEQELSAVAQVFAARAGKAKLLVTNTVDEDIIGGMRVQIGDTVYDGTVASQLARIEAGMIHGR